MPEISDPRLRRLYEYWLDRRGDREWPTRADFDPIDIRFILGNVILADVLPETPPRFRIRVHGTTLAQYAGYDMTGKMLDELPPPEFRDLARKSFTKAARSGEPLHIVADRMIDDRMQRYETIMLPLSNGGERVDMLLIGLVYDGMKR